MQEIIGMIDLTKKPDIYPTDNPLYYTKYCIDFYPESLPTVAPFNTEKDAHDTIVEMLGGRQHQAWFPELYQQPHETCDGCFGYKPQRTMSNGYCATCRKRMREG